jgi:lysozyme
MTQQAQRQLELDFKTALIKQLRRDEDEVLHAYTDSLGYLTIGVGRLIDKRGGGISAEESAYLLNNDIDSRLAELLQLLPWLDDLDEARRGAIVNMSFQMGVTGLLGFKNTLAMVQAGNYTKAAQAMLKSLWAKQTPERAKRLAEQMKTGIWQ